jgi:starch-binding outer membrane protein, SusD/RagB family
MRNYKLWLLALTGMIMVSCKKDWTEARSNKALVVPQTVKDFQAMLDNFTIMCENHPYIVQAGSDDYFLPYNIWQAWSEMYRNAYIWAPDIYGAIPTDNVNWNFSYRQVYYANVVLEGIESLDNKSTPEWENLKGSALYHRADGFFNIALGYAKQYEAASADADMGIPLRLNADPNEKSVRSTLKETYQQMIIDLKTAAENLPVSNLYKTRPSKPAAFAMLSRIYLAMKDYSQALAYADSCIRLNIPLMDYNTLNASQTNPIPPGNSEVLFHAQLALDPTNTYLVDSNLFKSYHVDDLRRAMFFKGTSPASIKWAGSYAGAVGTIVSRPFGGVALDEVYLTRAECYARAGNTAAALKDLDSLMIKRWKINKYTAATAANSTEALQKILTERRKEMPFRGLRWMDLKRLNSEGANITLTRVLNGQTYTLPPNDPRYVLPIPPDIINISGIPQNQRQ